MVSTLGDDTSALSTVKKWAAEVKKGRKSLEDDPRSGCPSTATTQESIDCIHQMVMNNRRLTISHLANVISISCKRVENMLHNELGMSKVLAWWVPGFWHLIKSSPDSSCQKRTWQDLRQTQIVFLIVFSPKINVGSITLNQRPKGNPYSGSTQLLLLQRRPRWFHPQKKWWPPYLGMRKALCSSITFRKVKLSMENIVPNC